MLVIPLETAVFLARLKFRQDKSVSNSIITIYRSEQSPNYITLME